MISDTWNHLSKTIVIITICVTCVKSKAIVKRQNYEYPQQYYQDQTENLQNNNEEFVLRRPNVNEPFQHESMVAQHTPHNYQMHGDFVPRLNPHINHPRMPHHQQQEQQQQRHRGDINQEYPNHPHVNNKEYYQNKDHTKEEHLYHSRMNHPNQNLHLEPTQFEEKVNNLASENQKKEEILQQSNINPSQQNEEIIPQSNINQNQHNKENVQQLNTNENQQNEETMMQNEEIVQQNEETDPQSKTNEQITSQVDKKENIELNNKKEEPIVSHSENKNENEEEKEKSEVILMDTIKKDNPEKENSSNEDKVNEDNENDNKPDIKEENNEKFNEIDDKIQNEEINLKDQEKLEENKNSEDGPHHSLDPHVASNNPEDNTRNERTIGRLHDIDDPRIMIENFRKKLKTARNNVEEMEAANRRRSDPRIFIYDPSLPVIPPAKALMTPRHRQAEEKEENVPPQKRRQSLLDGLKSNPDKQIDVRKLITSPIIDDSTSESSEEKKIIIDNHTVPTSNQNIENNGGEITERIDDAKQETIQNEEIIEPSARASHHKSKLEEEEIKQLLQVRDEINRIRHIMQVLKEHQLKKKFGTQFHNSRNLTDAEQAELQEFIDKLKEQGKISTNPLNGPESNSQMNDNIPEDNIQNNPSSVPDTEKLIKDIKKLKGTILDFAKQIGAHQDGSDDTNLEKLEEQILEQRRHIENLRKLVEKLAPPRNFPTATDSAVVKHPELEKSHLRQELQHLQSILRDMLDKEENLLNAAEGVAEKMRTDEKVRASETNTKDTTKKPANEEIGTLVKVLQNMQNPTAEKDSLSQKLAQMEHAIKTLDFQNHRARQEILLEKLEREVKNLKEMKTSANDNELLEKIRKIEETIEKHHKNPEPKPLDVKIQDLQKQIQQLSKPAGRELDLNDGIHSELEKLQKEIAALAKKTNKPSSRQLEGILTDFIANSVDSSNEKNDNFNKASPSTLTSNIAFGPNHPQPLFQIPFCLQRHPNYQHYSPSFINPSIQEISNFQQPINPQQIAGYYPQNVQPIGPNYHFHPQNQQRYRPQQQPQIEQEYLPLRPEPELYQSSKPVIHQIYGPPRMQGYEPLASQSHVFRPHKSHGQLYEHPKSHSQIYEAPNTQSQIYETANAPSQIYEAPRTQSQTYEDPKSQSSVYEAPKIQSQVYEASKTQNQAYSAPKIEEQVFIPPKLHSHTHIPFKLEESKYEDSKPQEKYGPPKDVQHEAYKPSKSDIHQTYSHPKLETHNKLEGQDYANKHGEYVKPQNGNYPADHHPCPQTKVMEEEIKRLNGMLNMLNDKVEYGTDPEPNEYAAVYKSKTTNPRPKRSPENYEKDKQQLITEIRERLSNLRDQVQKVQSNNLFVNSSENDISSEFSDFNGQRSVYQPEGSYYQPYGNKMSLKKKQKFDDLFIKVVKFILHKLEISAPYVVESLFNGDAFTFENSYNDHDYAYRSNKKLRSNNDGEDDSFLDDDDEYEDPPKFQKSFGGLFNSFQGFPGLLGFIPNILLKLLSNFSFFLNILKQNKFFKNFLFPGALILVVDGVMALLIWWFSADEGQNFLDFHNNQPNQVKNYN